MVKKKDDSTFNTSTKSVKKQHTEAIKLLCKEFYPRYISNKSNYRNIKEIIINNKEVYPQLTWNMVYK